MTLKKTTFIFFISTMVLAAILIFWLFNQYVVAPAERLGEYCIKEKNWLEKERIRLYYSPDTTDGEWGSWGNDLERYRKQCDKDWEPK